MKARTRHWTINGDFVALQPTGVPRYARETVLALDALIGECHPLTENLFTELVVPSNSGIPRLRNICVRHAPEYDKPRLPQLWVQMQLPGHVRGGLVSFCNLAPLRVKKQIVCIHDLHTYLYPESYSRIFRLAHRLMLPALGRRAAAITTVSSLSKGHLEQFGVASREKITVTYNGSDHARRWNPDNSRLQIGKRPYIFCLGQKQPYKNMRLIWSIAPALDALGFDIHMAGNVRRDDLPDRGRELPRNLRMLGRVSDDDLARAFQHAFCFLFPSRIEGFGLPAIEAMTWKCPVIAADAPCLPEICGDAALYAGPDDRQAWLDAIAALATDPALYQRQIACGLRRADRFSWRHVAEVYLQLMAQLDGIGILPEVAPHFQDANAKQRSSQTPTSV